MSRGQRLVRSRSGDRRSPEGFGGQFSICVWVSACASSRVDRSCLGGPLRTPPLLSARRHETAGLASHRPDEHIGVTPGTFKPWDRVAVNVGAIRNGSFSHEHYSSSPSKTLRAALGCSVRFAGNPGRTKERRIERLAGQHAQRPAKATEKPFGLRLKAGGK
jgi:hypothetical protein